MRILFIIESNQSNITNGVTTDPADLAVRGAILWGPKLLCYFYRTAKNTKCDITRCGF